MSARRLATLLAVLTGVLVVVVLGLDRPAAIPSFFAAPDRPTTPYVPIGNQLSATYYCAGSIVEGDDLAASVTIANPTDSPITGQLTAYVPDGAAIPVPIEIGARDRLTVALDELAPSVVAIGAIVELERTGAIVEQRASSAVGVSTDPCTTSASFDWYFADGTSVDGTTHRLLLTNPFPDSAVVDITIVTPEGRRDPTELQGFVVRPGAVAVVDVSGSVARDEEQLSLAVSSRRGRMVAAKIQTFNGGRRSGFVAALGAPAVGDEWLFADGESGEGISERYSVFNPTGEAVDVDVVFRPNEVAPELEPLTLTIDAGETVLVDTSTLVGLPPGLHTAVFRTFTTPSIVVERVITRPAGETVVTSVVIGARFGSPRWWLGTGVDAPTESGLVVQNATNLDGTFTVSVLGPGGLTPVASLTDVPAAAGSVAKIDLTAPELAGNTLLVTSDTLVLVVEQRYLRGSQPGLAGALALPE